jgi:hypothetical protein
MPVFRVDLRGLQILIRLERLDWWNCWLVRWSNEFLVHFCWCLLINFAEALRHFLLCFSLSDNLVRVHDIHHGLLAVDIRASAPNTGSLKVVISLDAIIHYNIYVIINYIECLLRVGFDKIVIILFSPVKIINSRLISCRLFSAHVVLPILILLIL